MTFVEPSVSCCYGGWHGAELRDKFSACEMLKLKLNVLGCFVAPSVESALRVWVCGS